MRGGRGERRKKGREGEGGGERESSFVPSPHAPPSKKQSGEQSQISRAYSEKVKVLNSH